MTAPDPLRNRIQGSQPNEEESSKEPLFLTLLIILAYFVHFLLVISAKPPYSFFQLESAAAAAKELARSQTRTGRTGIGVPFGGCDESKRMFVPKFHRIHSSRRIQDPPAFNRTVSIHIADESS